MKKLLRTAASLLSILYVAVLCFLPYYKLVEPVVLTGNMLFSNADSEQVIGYYTLLTFLRDGPGVKELLQAEIAVVLLILGLVNLVRRDEILLRIYCGISAAAVLWHFVQIVGEDVDHVYWKRYMLDSGMIVAGRCAFLILILAVAALPRKATKLPEASELPAMEE